MSKINYGIKSVNDLAICVYITDTTWGVASYKESLNGFITEEYSPSLNSITRRRKECDRTLLTK